MTRQRKRKHTADHARHGSSRLSVGGTVHQVKRARLTPEPPLRDSMNGSQTNTIPDGEWQTVRYKGPKHRNRANSRRNSEDSAVPGLRFQHRIVARDNLKIESLRNLALYVLADGTAPTWVAIKRPQDIQKVVVLMLPGLDDDMIDNAENILRPHKDASSSRDGPGPNGSDEKPTTFTGEDPNKHVSYDDIRWLLRDNFPVKAPTDHQHTKIYSPLQAMLIQTFDDIDKKTHSKQSGSAFSSVRTPIVDFIHTADELRDAEYPIHPASYTSQADASLEQARRQSAGQALIDGWVDSEVKEPEIVIPPPSNATPRDPISQGLTVYAIDCEMVLTSDAKSSLARISVIAWPDGRVVLDEYVKPSLPITNYFTQYSGITEEILENVTTTLPDVQARLAKILTPSTILLGHSLESDLNAMKMTHPFIVDTSMIYPHPRGLPLRSSLKFLANKYLKREIQKGGANGHNSVEDAKAVLDLVKLKCEKGPKWGTNEANGETIFKLLSRKVGPDGQWKTSAIVEYGTPERGFGQDATVAIGCQNDEEITKGVIHAAVGDNSEQHDVDENDSTHKKLPPGGVNFVWGRLRALEFARGWGTNTFASSQSQSQPQQTPQPESSSSTKSSTENTHPDTNSDPSLTAPLLQTLHNIQKIHAALSAPTTTKPTNFTDQNQSNSDQPLVLDHNNTEPRPQSPTKKTLLILYSGTSSMARVSALQAQQAQYRREFKTKKWDELSVQWTDVEEQELRREVGKARMGWAWVGVV